MNFKECEEECRKATKQLRGKATSQGTIKEILPVPSAQEGNEYRRFFHGIFKGNLSVQEAAHHSQATAGLSGLK